MEANNQEIIICLFIICLSLLFLSTFIWAVKAEYRSNKYRNNLFKANYKAQEQTAVQMALFLELRYRTVEYNKAIRMFGKTSQFMHSNKLENFMRAYNLDRKKPEFDFLPALLNTFDKDKKKIMSMLINEQNEKISNIARNI